jgi:calreticulin
MFGPDICGYATKKIHVILSHPDPKDPKTVKNHLIKKDLRAEDDQLTHVYTLRLMPNNTYGVYVDKKEVGTGKLEEDWDMLAPAKIKVRGERGRLPPHEGTRARAPALCAPPPLPETPAR